MIVVYHKNCVDGFTAAWAILKAHMNEQIEFIPMHYQEATDLSDKLKDQDVLVVDFSFKRPIMERYARLAKSFRVLDHHKTAIEECKGLDYCTFDLNKSGAMLTWEYVHPNEPAPDFIQYVQDYDLWKFALPDSEAINSVIQITDKTFSSYDMLANRMIVDRDAMVNEGNAILKFEASVIVEAERNAMIIKIDNWLIPAINSPVLISKCVGKLAVGAPFAASFFMRTDGKWQFSLRARKGSDVDVGVVAAKYGGGGHAGSAGFATDSLEPFLTGKKWDHS